MPRTQEQLARLLEREGVVGERVVEAFRRVDRRDFVPGQLRRRAYEDRPVPLPEGQTTSQPSLIARMVDALQLSGSDRVLEVGTGFGFQTALLSLLAGEVISIERFATLAAAARENLERTGCTGIEVLVGDGWRGVPERAPFDAIVVSAAAAELPAALVEQLGEGGRMVIPLKRGAGDDVVLFAKRSGRLERERLLTPARFVPLVQGAAL